MPSSKASMVVDDGIDAWKCHVLSELPVATIPAAIILFFSKYKARFAKLVKSSMPLPMPMQAPCASNSW